MRKYRFGEANGAAGWLKRTNIIYFVLAWNAFGICAYQYWKTRKSKDNPEWQQMSSAQKYLSYTSDPDDKVTVVTMSGFTPQTKEMSMGEYLKPKPPATKPVTSDDTLE